MRIAEVIGTVTLVRVHPLLRGMRWVIAVPHNLKSLKAKTRADGEDFVVLDEMHADIGQTIAVSEGVEAAMPFHPDKKPVDAYAAGILDTVVIQK